jgi:hypothetical protein
LLYVQKDELFGYKVTVDVCGNKTMVIFLSWKSTTLLFVSIVFFLGPLQVPNTNHTSSWGLNYGEGGFHRFSQYAVFTYGCVTNRSVLNCTQTTTLGDNSMLSITFIAAQNMWELMVEHVRGMDKDKRTWHFFVWNS